MEKENTARYKSKKFAVRIVNLYNHLCDNHKEFVMSKQVLRCGTSIGANLAEADYGISKKDFLAKVYIALKETSETRYWLELLFDTQYLEEDEYLSLKKDVDELQKMLTATTKSTAKELDIPDRSASSIMRQPSPITNH